jgi:hypothetical protein
MVIYSELNVANNLLLIIIYSDVQVNGEASIRGVGASAKKNTRDKKNQIADIRLKFAEIVREDRYVGVSRNNAFFVASIDKFRSVFFHTYRMIDNSGRCNLVLEEDSLDLLDIEGKTAQKRLIREDYEKYERPNQLF